jgi:CO/xanthine dehydrogenase FAD-binding subunit
MKAAPFDYVRAESVDQVVELLAQHGADAKPIAGGQSLVPMMAMRLARPALLIDINRLGELKHIEIGREYVVMGAATRQRDVADHRALLAALPLVHDALQWVGHVQTRNRGTVGGSLVHADPSAELPLAAAILGATLRVRSEADGERLIDAADFFLGPMFTGVGETECLVEIKWPVWQGPGVFTAFDETAMRHGDFAMAAAACQLQFEPDGTVLRAAIGLGGMDGIPLAFPDLAAQLVGKRIDAQLSRDIARAAVDLTSPGTDLHADADYRRHLGVVMMQRVLTRVAADAGR